MSLMTDMGTAVRTEILKRTYPTGAIAAFAMATPPAGWLKCNGQQVSRATYADLFTAIGTTFGVGNGTTTFTLPDLRGEFVRGFDDGRGVDAGRTFGSSQADELKSHVHSDVTVNGSIADNGDPGNYVLTAATQFQALTNVGGSVGATGGTETRPRNIALMWCIKAYGETINEGIVDVAALATYLEEVEDTLTANVSAVNTSKVDKTSEQALRATDALSISGSDISLNKGDGTSETITLPAGTAPTTAQVGTATAGLAVGSLGSYALLYYGTTTNPGTTVSGSSTYYSSAGASSSTSPSGTWRCMGKNTGGTGGFITLWLRIA